MDQPTRLLGARSALDGIGMRTPITAPEVRGRSALARQRPPGGVRHHARARGAVRAGAARPRDLSHDHLRRRRFGFRRHPSPAAPGAVAVDDVLVSSGRVDRRGRRRRFRHRVGRPDRGPLAAARPVRHPRLRDDRRRARRSRADPACRSRPDVADRRRDARRRGGAAGARVDRRTGDGDRRCRAARDRSGARLPDHVAGSAAARRSARVRSRGSIGGVLAAARRRLRAPHRRPRVRARPDRSARSGQLRCWRSRT